MKRLLSVVAVVVILGGAIWLAVRKSAPPQVPFTKVARQTIESTLVTNGRVEPVEWTAVRAERAGFIEQVPVERGQSVAKGAVLATIRSEASRAELAAAEARVEQAKARLAVIERGGASAELVEIDRALARTRLDRKSAQTEVEALERLVKQEAATGQELTAARQKVEQADAELRALEQKRVSLVSLNDKAVAAAQLRDAQAAVSLARRNLAESTVEAPIAGVVYALYVRRGGFLNPGDQVADIGRLDRLRAIIFVDEPELGRVGKGMPVKITWDALPGRQWTGEVDQLPTQVIANGTRQVGEVIALIDNEGQALIPGTNINAEIESQVVKAALSIPKEAIRRRGNEVGVYVLEGDHTAWRPVKLGASSLTHSQVLEGVKEGDLVAGITDVDLDHGARVTPVD